MLKSLRCIFLVFSVFTVGAANAQAPNCDTVKSCALEIVKIANDLKSQNQDILNEIDKLRAEIGELENKVDANETAISGLTTGISNLDVNIQCKEAYGQSSTWGKTCSANANKNFEKIEVKLKRGQ